MLTISEQDIISRLWLDNPWWEDISNVPFRQVPKRDYFKKFFNLFTKKHVKRAVIMMGPRRVGKTVILYQSVIDLLNEGIEPDKILFVSMDTPMYLGLSLEKMLNIFMGIFKHNKDTPIYIIFDEIQYLKDWERHLKDLVDHYPQARFVASGSAAAALKLKSQESGAGRFTHFMLPPLTFAEYLKFSGNEYLIEKDEFNPINDGTNDINELNKRFVDYINYGGYPEVVMDSEVRQNTKRYVKEDIIDKVLLRDLPSLYGISNIQELNQLFAVLAYNTGNEVSPEELSQTSGVAKHDLQKYLEYLEAAFLIVRVAKVNMNSKHFKRQRQFKIYLTNPSMRAALFKPVSSEHEAMGNLAETAIFSQWFHSPEMDLIRYARWSGSSGGEVDIVKLKPDFKPNWGYEIKWSDRYYNEPRKLRSLLKFAKKNQMPEGCVGASTKTLAGENEVDGIKIKFFTCSLHCYQVGRRVTISN